MCLAIPNKVIKVEKDWATVQSGNPALPTGRHQHRVNLSLLKNVKAGDYLLIHNNLALNKIHKTEAERILKMISGLNK